MLWEAKKYGARVALYGRKINNAEHQLTFVRYLRALADEEIEPVEAVRAYHSDLKKLNIRPHRSLEQDLLPSATAQSYGGTPQPAGPAAAPRPDSSPAPRSEEPDFSRMTPAEKVQWNLARWRRILD
jgi:hypothetical protein